MNSLLKQEPILEQTDYERYDVYWKRDIEIPELNNTQLIIVQTEDYDETFVQRKVGPLQLTLSPDYDLEEEILHFLGDPGLKIGVTSNIMSIISYFLPPPLIKEVTCQLNKLLYEVIKKTQIKMMLFKKRNIMDCENGFIVDILVYYKQDNELEDKLLDFILPYSCKNHVLYLMFPMSLQMIAILEFNQIYCVCKQEYQKELIQNSGLYQYANIKVRKSDNEIFIFPRKKLIYTQGRAEDAYMKKFLIFENDFRQHLKNLRIYRSPFYFSGKSFENENKLRVEFEEYFEAIIHNGFLIMKEQNYKLFRHDVAKLFLGEKGKLLISDREEAKRRQTAEYTDTSINTNFLSFGLSPNYIERCHTPIPVPSDDSFKYCPVCMRMNGLSKPYFRCLLCEKILGYGKIFLCPFPCFDYFHKNPSEFMYCNMEILKDLGEGVYFKNEPFQPPVEIEEPKKKKGGGAANFKGATGFQNVTRDIYKNKQMLLEDKDLTTILTSLNRQPPVNPSPTRLQPIISQPNKQQENSNKQLGHRKDMQELESLQRENEDKIRQQEEEAYKQFKQHQQEVQEQKQQALQQRSSSPQKKKEKKQQKGRQEVQDLELNTTSPFEQFMESIKKKTKVEESQ